MQFSRSLLSLGLLATVATAQLSVVIPNGTATVGGNSSNAFPWGASANTWPGLRLMCVYDAANFTAQGVTAPILINRLRWRPNEGVAAFTGGTFAQADVRLSTAPMDYTGLTTNFTTNHGPDLTTVYSGPVTHAAGGGGPGGAPEPWSVDISLTTPFLYNPGAGDLVIDCDYPGGANFTGTSLPQMDVQATGSLAGRIWASAAYPTANGAALDHGVVVEVSYAPPSGYAYSSSYGEGCYERASATVYELFANGAFDLSNTAIQLIPTGTGYAVLPTPATWWTPTGTNLGLTDDTVSAAQALGFTLNYPGGSTTAIQVSSNGFVWAQPNTNNGCCAGDPAALRSQGARWAMLWNDLNPGIGGTVVFDQDLANQAAYVTFTGVPEYNQAANLNTFQIAFFSTGVVELRWQACAVTAHQVLVGWSPGTNTRDPGNIDLSTALPLVTEPDASALALAASARPVTGTTTNLDTTNVPAGSPLGAMLFGLTQFVPGQELTALGMPGCYQHLSIDASAVWFPTGTNATFPFVVPNQPGLSGVEIKTQSAALVPGINPTGALTSNAVRLVIGTL